MTERDPFAVYRAQLEALGFRPSKRLGQNFLLAPELHRAIAEASGAGRDDVALEIGAGLGFLTRELAQRAGAVVASEIDPRLCTLLGRELPRMQDGGRVVLVPGDALSRGRLAPALAGAVAAAQGRLAGGGLHVAANLPYAITGPLLASLITDLEPLPRRMALLVQMEVGDRLRATAGGPAFGSLSALVQSCYSVARERRVGREVFRPRPNVDSAIVVLDRLTQPWLAGRTTAERCSFAAFIRALFSGRRRKVRHTMDMACMAAGLPGEVSPGPLTEMRPSEMQPEDFQALWRLARHET